MNFFFLQPWAVVGLVYKNRTVVFCASKNVLINFRAVVWVIWAAGGHQTGGGGRVEDSERSWGHSADALEQALCEEETEVLKSLHMEVWAPKRNLVGFKRAMNDQRSGAHRGSVRSRYTCRWRKRYIFDNRYLEDFLQRKYDAATHSRCVLMNGGPFSRHRTVFELNESATWTNAGLKPRV